MTDGPMLTFGIKAPKVQTDLITPVQAHGLSCSAPVNWVHRAHGHYQGGAFQFEIEHTRVEPGFVLGVIHPQARGQFGCQLTQAKAEALVIAFHHDLIEALLDHLGDGVVAFEVVNSVRLISPDNRSFMASIDMVALCPVKNPGDYQQLGFESF
jgi:hypothetical protein